MVGFSWWWCRKFPKNPRLPSIPLLWGILDFDDGDSRRQPPGDTTWQQV
ncbi:hypothetical protein A2U01_0042928, partial [Trifolium medium]|nr:hypothetical protein [Trifolium medium]